MTRDSLIKIIVGVAALWIVGPPTSSLAAAPNLFDSVPIYIYSPGLGGAEISQVAVGGNTAAVSSNLCVLAQVCPVILYQLTNGTWVETARLLPAPSETSNSGGSSVGGPGGSFGAGVAVSPDGNTVFVGDADAQCADVPTQPCGVVDIYNEPANGWSDMPPTSQITIGASIGESFGGRLLVSGNTLFVTASVNCSNGASTCGAVLVYNRPQTGWSVTAPVATLTAANGFGFNPGGALAFDPSTSTLAACFGASEVYVFQAGINGFTNSSDVAELASSDFGFGNLIGLGNALSISGNVIAAGGPNSSLRAGSGGGIVLLWVMPAGGWHDMSNETAALSPSFPTQTLALGSGVLVDDNEIVAATDKSLLYVYQEPAGGWTSMTESSQVSVPILNGGPLSMVGPNMLEQGMICAAYGGACQAGAIYGAPQSAAAATALVISNANVVNNQQSNSAIPVVLANNPVQIFMTISNISQTDANDVVLNIPIAANTTDYSLINGNCTTSNTVVICSLGDIAANTSTNETLTFNPPAKRSQFTISATASAANPNWDLLDNTTSLPAISDNPPVTPGSTVAAVLSGHTLSGVLTATDSDNDTLTFSLTPGRSEGQATVTPQGNYTYVPPATTMANGSDSFDYSVSDGLLTAQGTVNVYFNPTPPIGVSSSTTTNENQALSGTLLANEVVPVPIIFSIVGEPGHGTVTLTNASTGAFTYTPAPGYSGDDSFTYTASNIGGTSAITTMTIAVAAISDNGGGSGNGSGSTSNGHGGGGIGLTALVILIGVEFFRRYRDDRSRHR